MGEVKVAAPIVAKPEHHEASCKATRAMLKSNRSEPGCIQYDLHEEQGNPGHFVFLERWKSAQALEEHMAMTWHNNFLAESGGKLEKLEVKKLIDIKE